MNKLFKQYVNNKDTHMFGHFERKVVLKKWSKTKFLTENFQKNELSGSR